MFLNGKITLKSNWKFKVYIPNLGERKKCKVAAGEETKIDFWSERKSDPLSEEGWSHNSTKRIILSGWNAGLRCSEF